jgi:hypothetical protein
MSSTTPLKEYRLTGGFAIDSDDPEQLANDAEFLGAIAESVGLLAGVPSEYVTCSVNVPRARNTGSVWIEYKIVIPAGDTDFNDGEVNTVLGSLNTTSQEVFTSTINEVFAEKVASGELATTYTFVVRDVWLQVVEVITHTRTQTDTSTSTTSTLTLTTGSFSTTVTSTLTATATTGSFSTTPTSTMTSMTLTSSTATSSQTTGSYSTTTTSTMTSMTLTSSTATSSQTTGSYSITTTTQTSSTSSATLTSSTTRLTTTTTRLSDGAAEDVLTSSTATTSATGVLSFVSQAFSFVAENLTEAQVEEASASALETYFGMAPSSVDATRAARRMQIWQVAFSFETTQVNMLTAKMSSLTWNSAQVAVFGETLQDALAAVASGSVEVASVSFQSPTTAPVLYPAAGAPEPLDAAQAESGSGTVVIAFVIGSLALLGVAVGGGGFYYYKVRKLKKDTKFGGGIPQAGGTPQAARRGEDMVVDLGERDAFTNDTDRPMDARSPLQSSKKKNLNKRLVLGEDTASPTLSRENSGNLSHPPTPRDDGGGRTSASSREGLERPRKVGDAYGDESFSNDRVSPLTSELAFKLFGPIQGWSSGLFDTQATTEEGSCATDGTVTSTDRPLSSEFELDADEVRIQVDPILQEVLPAREAPVSRSTIRGPGQRFGDRPRSGPVPVRVRLGVSPIPEIVSL